MSSVFSPFFRERSFKSRQNPRADFFKARKHLEGFNKAFFNLLLLSFVLDGLFTNPVYSRRRSRFVNSAFSNKKILAPKIEVLFMTNKFRRKCLQKFCVLSKQEKE